MSNDHRNEGAEFLKFLQALTPEDRARGNEIQMRDAEKEHQEFRAAFQAGKCYLCGGDLAGFDQQVPCLHWLLKPPGFTKRHFTRITQRYGLFQIQTYLRWLASEEGFARHINDLSDEGTGKLVELTIRYKDCEWAFSCALTDFTGHDGAGADARLPHYHFQMRYKKQAFIRYNEFHIPLHRKDIVSIEARRLDPEFFRPRFPGGEGMGDLLNDDTVEHLVRASVHSENEAESTLSMNTLIMAPEGKQLSGQEIFDMIQNARKKGVSVASVAAESIPDANVRTIVEPGPGVVEQAPRTPHKR